MTDTKQTERDVVKEARSLLAKATPGPWYSNERGYVHSENRDAAEPLIADCNHTISSVAQELANAALIARAPELIKTLCDEVERLRSNRPRIKEAMLDEIVDCDNDRGVRCKFCAEPMHYFGAVGHRPELRIEAYEHTDRTFEEFYVHKECWISALKAIPPAATSPASTQDAEQVPEP